MLHGNILNIAFKQQKDRLEALEILASLCNLNPDMIMIYTPLHPHDDDLILFIDENIESINLGLLNKIRSILNEFDVLGEFQEINSDSSPDFSFWKTIKN